MGYLIFVLSWLILCLFLSFYIPCKKAVDRRLGAVYYDLSCIYRRTEEEVQNETEYCRRFVYIGTLFLGWTYYDKVVDDMWNAYA